MFRIFYNKISTYHELEMVVGQPQVHEILLILFTWQLNHYLLVYMITIDNNFI